MTPPPFIDLPLDEFRPVDMFGRQSVVRRAQEGKESLIVAAKDGKRPLVFHLKAGPRPTSPPIRAFVFALMLPTGVDPLDGLGRNVSRPGRFVFHSRHARRDNSRHLVWTRSGSSGGRRGKRQPKRHLVRRRCRKMSGRAWKTSRPGRDTFLPRSSSGSTPVETTNANLKAMMGGDVGRGPAFR